jgi:hypothetical protein
LAKTAQHPHAALLFADFVLSPDGQRYIKQASRVPVNRRVDTSFDQRVFRIVDWPRCSRNGTSGRAAGRRSSCGKENESRARRLLRRRALPAARRSTSRSGLPPTATWRSRPISFPAGMATAMRCGAVMCA